MGNSLIWGGQTDRETRARRGGSGMRSVRAQWRDSLLFSFASCSAPQTSGQVNDSGCGTSGLYICEYATKVCFRVGLSLGEKGFEAAVTFDLKPPPSPHPSTDPSSCPPPPSMTSSPSSTCLSTSLSFARPFERDGGTAAARTSSTATSPFNGFIYSSIWAIRQALTDFSVSSSPVPPSLSTYIGPTFHSEP